MSLLLSSRVRAKFEARYLLLTTYYLPLTTYYLLLTTYYLLLTTYYFEARYACGRLSHFCPQRPQLENISGFTREQPIGHPNLNPIQP